MMVKEGYKEVRIGPKKELIPESWGIQFLGNVADFKQGLQVPVENQLYKKRKGYTRFLRIVDYTQNTEDIRFIKNPGEKHIVDKKDIIMVRYGEAGLVCRGFRGVIANNLFKINIDPNSFLKSYTYYYLSQNRVYNYLSSLRLTSAMPAINFGIVSNLQILVPPKKEQKKIASILSSVDETIEKTDQVIEKTKELKKGLMQELLTKGIGHSEFKESVLGEIPNNWEVKRIKDCCKILDKQRIPLNQKERDEIPGNIPYYGANGVVDYIGEYIFDDRLILLAEDGGHFHEYQNREIAYIIEGKSWVNNHAHVLKPLDSYHLDWIYYSLVHKNIIPYVSGSTRMKLNQSSLKTIPIQIPPLEEQKKIANILSTVDEKIQKEEEYKDKLEELKKGLMQKLLTGEVRVKVAN